MISKNYFKEKLPDFTGRMKTEFIDADTVINFDELSPETLSDYLADRSQRRYYQKIIPALRSTELEKRRETEYESLFLSSLSRVLDQKGIRHTPDLLTDTLRWWKTKVIHIRPIEKDDEKAWRMIIRKIRNKNS